MKSIQEKKDILTRFINEVWSGGDAEAAEKYIGAKYTIHHDPGDPWEGKELDLAGYKERVRMLRAAFPDQLFDLRELVGEGETVVMAWLWTATHRGDLPGFPATGKVVSMSGATVYYFDEDSRLMGHWQITDRLGVYQQLRAAVG